ncbi:hypothetical protein, partial [Mesorhizobium jarvisii]|uniref:hypothetical protein n=1 Tax=Mesorhizobium jarvisii TaxID=1777867 RepID=UPI001F0B2F8C
NRIIAELYSGDIDHRPCLQSNAGFRNPPKRALSIQQFIDVSLERPMAINSSTPARPFGVRCSKSQAVGFSSAAQTTPHLPVTRGE